MSQLTYNMNPAPATAGMVAESREANVIISKVAEGLVPVGLLASPGTRGEVGPSVTVASAQSTTPGQVKAQPTGITDDPILDSQYIGVPIYDSSRPPYTSLNEYSDKDYVPVLRKGVVWVATEGAVTQYADVYVRTVAGGGFLPGNFSAGAGANKVKFARGRWMSTTTAAGLAILEIW